MISNTEIEIVKLDDLILNQDLQPRVKLNQKTVDQYADIYAEHGGDGMEPIRAFKTFDGLVLTRGFTRMAAAKQSGLDRLPCEVIRTYDDDEDMLIDSLGGNKHGQTLNNADKNRAVKLYHEKITETTWQPTREVAKLIGCSHELVAKYRRENTASTVDSENKADDDTIVLDPDDAETNAKPGGPRLLTHDIHDLIINEIGPEDDTPIDELCLDIEFISQQLKVDQNTVINVAQNSPKFAITIDDEGTKIGLKGTETKPSDIIEKQKSEKEPDNTVKRLAFQRERLATLIANEEKENLTPELIDACYLALIIGVESEPKAPDYSNQEETFRLFIDKITAELIEQLRCPVIASAHLPAFDVIATIYDLDWQAIQTETKNKFDQANNA